MRACNKAETGGSDSGRGADTCVGDSRSPASILHVLMILANHQTRSWRSAIANASVCTSTTIRSTPSSLYARPHPDLVPSASTSASTAASGSPANSIKPSWATCGGQYLHLAEDVAQAQALFDQQLRPTGRACWQDWRKASIPCTRKSLPNYRLPLLWSVQQSEWPAT